MLADRPGRGEYGSTKCVVDLLSALQTETKTAAALDSIVTVSGARVKAWVQGYNPFSAANWRESAESSAAWFEWARTADSCVRVEGMMDWLFAGTRADCEQWIADRQTAAATKAAFEKALQDGRSR